MTAQLDVSRWLTKDQAAAQLGISLRSLERKLAAGEIPSTKRGREVVIDPASIGQHQRPRPAQALPALVPPPPPTAPNVARMADNVADNPQPSLSVADLHNLLGRFSLTLANPCRWLTLDEASAFSGLSVGYLRRMIAAGVLPSVVDQHRKIRRDVLDSIDGGVDLPKARKRKRGAKAKGRRK